MSEIGFFQIDEQLPSLNTTLSVYGTHFQKGGQLKKKIQSDIDVFIMSAVRKKTLPYGVKEPIELLIEWHEKTKKRDCDNIFSAKKFILDAMQDMGIIPNDNRNYVKQIFDIEIDDEKDFVVVRLFKAGSLMIVQRKAEGD